jgi:DNA-binding beta-propeller fold protein YncE
VGDFANNRVQKFDSSGNFLLKFGSSGALSGQFAGPRQIVVDPADGHVFVVDAGHSRVEEFNSRGVYLSQLGTAGTASGQFSSPDGVALDPSTGALYVVSNQGAEHVARFGLPAAPVCAASSASTTGASAVAIQLSCTAASGFAPGYEIASPPGHGTVSALNPYTGSFAYAAQPGFAGTDTFTYHGVLDGTQSADRTVRITVSPPPPPVCHHVAVATTERHSVTIHLSCSKPGAAPLTYRVDVEAANGTLGTINQATGQVTYAPAAGFSGIDSFTYHASNSGGAATPQTVTIRVRPVVKLTSPAPGAHTTQRTLVFRGTGSVGEPDSDQVTVKIVAGKSIGGRLVEALHATLAPSGAWSITPSPALPAGTYTVRAQQSDTAGLVGFSPAHTFTVRRR